MNPDISIIIPIYNSSLQLERCLQSVIGQTFKKFEVILVNDGSTDNSEDICKRYLKLDSRFQYYKKENGGKSSAVNYGYNRASGNFISIIDSDDFIEPKLYEATYAIANTYHVDIVNYSYHCIKKDTIEKSSVPFPKNIVMDAHAFKELLKSDYPNKNSLLWFTWTNLIRKSLLDTCHILHDESLKIGVDSTFNLECYLNAHGIYSITDVFYNNVYNNNSITQVHFKPNLLDNLTNQFHARKRIYEKYHLYDVAFEAHFARYYIEHSLSFLINNEKNSLNKLQPKKLETIRNSEMYNYCFKNYTTYSKYLTFKKKTTIYLFKNNYFITLVLLHNLFGKN